MSIKIDKKKAALLLLVLVFVLLLQTAAFGAGKSWVVNQPKTGSDGSVTIESKNLKNLTDLILTIIQWVFGVAGAILGVIVLIIGIQIAMTSSKVHDRAELSTRLGRLVLGAMISFGAWFIIALIKGFFTSS